MRNGYETLFVNLEARDQLVDVNVSRRILLKQILKELVCELVIWIHLAQDRDQWRAVANSVMNFGVR
jgi:hypothetical protein